MAINKEISVVSPQTYTHTHNTHKYRDKQQGNKQVITVFGINNIDTYLAVHNEQSADVDNAEWLSFLPQHQSKCIKHTTFFATFYRKARLQEKQFLLDFVQLRK